MFMVLKPIVVPSRLTKAVSATGRCIVQSGYVPEIRDNSSLRPHPASCSIVQDIKYL